MPTQNLLVMVVTILMLTPSSAQMDRDIKDVDFMCVMQFQMLFDFDIQGAYILRPNLSGFGIFGNWLEDWVSTFLGTDHLHQHET